MRRTPLSGAPPSLPPSAAPLIATFRWIIAQLKVLSEASYIPELPVLNGSATYDPASLGDGVGATTTVTVDSPDTGVHAELGDFVQVSFSKALQGITLTGWVSAQDVVSVRFQNESGGTLDLASGTLYARVTKR